MKHEINQATATALANGATMMVVKLSSKSTDFERGDSVFVHRQILEVVDVVEDRGEMIPKLSNGQSYYPERLMYIPFKQGDKVWLAEEFYPPTNYTKIIYKAEPLPEWLIDDIIWRKPSEMQEHQSRFHFTVGEVEVKRASDVTGMERLKLRCPISHDYDEEVNDYIDWLKTQNIEQSDIVALIRLIKE